MCSVCAVQEHMLMYTMSLVGNLEPYLFDILKRASWHLCADEVKYCDITAKSEVLNYKLRWWGSFFVP